MAKRPGRTIKLSISLDPLDVATLRKRAKRSSGGNVSAAIADLIHVVREHEGREALAQWLSAGRPEPTDEAMEAVRAEWRGATRGKRRTKAA